ncbi:hypothetical protein, partial [Aquabacterium sp.]
FIARSFYPAMAAVLLYAVYPKIQEVDVRALTNRLTSATVAGAAFTFGDAEKVGAETAPLNRQMVALERQVQSLQTQLSQALPPTAAVSPKPAPDTAKAKAEQDKLWRANAAYTTLVFHSASSRAPSAKVTQALLNAGFTASDTETDFNELQKVEPKPGTAFITYTTSGAQVLDDIRAKIMALGVVKEVNVNPRTIALKRGDVQVLVF